VKRELLTRLNTSRNHLRFEFWGCHPFLFFLAGFIFSFANNSRAQTESPWPTFRFDAGLTAQAKVNGPRFPVKKDPISFDGPQNMRSPVVARDGTIIVTFYDHSYVYAFKPDRTLRWRFPESESAENFRAPATIGKDDTTVYIGSTNGHLYALNIASGKVIYEYADLPGAVETAAVINSDGLIFVVVNARRLYAFHPNLKPKWPVPSSWDEDDAPKTPVIGVDSLIYVAVGSKIYVFGQSGGSKGKPFEHPEGGNFEWLVMGQTPLAKRIWAGSATRPFVVAFSAAHTDSIIVDNDFGLSRAPALGRDNKLYLVSARNGELRVFDTISKTQCWSVERHQFTNMPVVDSNGTVYVIAKSDSDDSIFALLPKCKHDAGCNKKPGCDQDTVLWREPVVLEPEQSTQSLAFGPDGTIYIPGNNRLYIISPELPHAKNLKLDSGDNQRGCIDSTLGQPLKVLVKDQYDKPLIQYPVHFEVLTGGGERDHPVDYTDENGIAETYWKLGPEAGKQQLKAFIQDLNKLEIDSVIFNATAELPKIGGDAEVLFPDTPIKDSSQTNYPIRNISPSAIIIASLKIVEDQHSSFRLLDMIHDRSIKSGESLTVRLQFAPKKEPGQHAATLQISVKDSPCSPHVVPLKGNAIAPQIVVSPDCRIFKEEVCIGETGTCKLLKISNAGSANLNIFLSVLGSAFRANPLSLSIPKGESRFVDIIFSPEKLGTNSAILEIVSNDPHPERDTLRVPLRGVGIGPKIGGDTEVDFGFVKLGKQATDSCKIENDSDRCNLQIDSCSIIGENQPDFAVVSCGDRQPIPPGGSSYVRLQFNPQAAGERKATLLVYSNDSTKNPFSVSLRGVGLPACNTIPPSAPENLKVVQIGWQCADSFSVTWQNPSGRSDIKFAYYRIDTPPACDSCGTKVPISDPPGIDGIKVDLSGEHRIYVWLVDGCGNVASKNYAVGTAKLDNVPPSFNHTQIKEWQANQPIPIRVLEKKDEHSGIKSLELHYRRGGEPDSRWQVIVFPNTSNEVLIPADKVSTRGVEHFIVAEDFACNRFSLPRSKKFYSIQVRILADALTKKHAGGTAQTAYRLRAFPLILDKPAAREVASYNFRNIDIYSVRLWDIDTLRAQETFPYSEYPNIREFKPYRAMFLITLGDVELKNTNGRTVATADSFPIPLHQGWNLVASPFNFEVPFRNSSLAKFDGCAFTYEGAWQGINTSYKFRPWEGLAIKAPKADTLKIWPRETASNNLPKANAVPASAGADWFIRINAFCQDAKDVINTVGVAPDAAEEWDAYELLEPPPIGDYVLAYFSHRNWQKYPDLYTTDFRPRSSDGYEWEFRVYTNMRGEAVHLQFENIGSAPLALQVKLLDVDLKFPHDLRREPAYGFRSSDIEGQTRLFRLVVGNQEYVESKLPQSAPVPESFELPQNFPNPFNPATTFKFGLPKPASVSFVIYNIKGEVVRTLLDAQEKDAGYHLLVWDGRDNLGKSAASGVYFYQLKTRETTLTRKMALAK
jgi:outer membrane protein assembly factor BamB